MPSLITQTIGSAVSSVSSANPASINTQSRPTAQADQTSQTNLHQVLRAASEAATVAPNLKSRERIPQVPKRVEGTYSPRKNRATAQAKDETPEEIKSTDSDSNSETFKARIDTEV